MIVKKLAINPVNAINPRTVAPVPSPNTALNPSNNGVAEVPMAAAPPPTPVFRNRVPTANSISVVRPHMVARGMSRARS